ncbi:MAG: hypothetical protein ACI9VR_004093, partial [Cognaticolwellia sp.]
AGTFYRDWDLDGFGDDAAALESCFLPEDYADVPGDGDDRDALTTRPQPKSVTAKSTTTATVWRMTRTTST